MKYRVEETDPNDKNAAKKYLDETSAAYSKVMKQLELNPNDPFYVSGFKLFMRLVFVLFCIALSPFVLIGLMMAVIVVA